MKLCVLQGGGLHTHSSTRQWERLYSVEWHKYGRHNNAKEHTGQRLTDSILKYTVASKNTHFSVCGKIQLLCPQQPKFQEC